MEEVRRVIFSFEIFEIKVQSFAHKKAIRRWLLKLRRLTSLVVTNLHFDDSLYQYIVGV